MKKIEIYFVVFILGIAGCETIVDADKLISEGNKLVVNSVISPTDSLINVEVSRSIPILGTKSYIDYDADIVKDATVIISDGENEMELFFEPDLNMYAILSASMPITEGKTYSLVVSSNNEVVTANCTVPFGTSADDILADDSPNDRGAVFNISWVDIMGDKSYYQLNFDYRIQESGSSSSYSNNYFKSDENDNITKFSVTEFSDFWGNTSNAAREIDVILFSVDENYFKYQKQLDNLQDENPFG
ncbi:MAG: DUF4249 domain-containing protein, partial [Cyclobacteriaceae bacterium]|nr:DUF4249 domain-containing protein [Cyclobacteriaceae bacterium]